MGEGGYPHLDDRGGSTDWGGGGLYPHQDWMGYPLSELDGGIPPSGLDGVPPPPTQQSGHRAVDAGGLC